MLNKVLITPIDNLVDLVRKNKNCTKIFLINQLKISEEIIDKWLIILEEFKIIKIKYSGFDAFIDYVEKDIQNVEIDKLNILTLREDFVNLAKQKKFNYEKINLLWPKFVDRYEEQIKDLFFLNAKQKKFDQTKTIRAWNKYKEDLVKW